MESNLLHNPARKLVVVAASQVGVRETKPNDGPEIREYLRTTGNKAGDPWCAAFVAWCAKQAFPEGGWLLPLTASCHALFEAGKKHGMVYHDPLPNDVMIVYFPTLSRYAHTGIVTSATPSEIHTIEGNTNPNGGREGYGVFERVRTRSPRIKYLRWWQVPPSR